MLMPTDTPTPVSPAPPAFAFASTCASVVFAALIGCHSRQRCLKARTLARTGRLGQVEFFSRGDECCSAFSGVRFCCFDEAAVGDDLNHAAGLFKRPKLFVVHVAAHVTQSSDGRV
jgi:hypothetical protein